MLLSFFEELAIAGAVIEHILMTPVVGKLTALTRFGLLHDAFVVDQEDAVQRFVRVVRQPAVTGRLMPCKLRFTCILSDEAIEVNAEYGNHRRHLFRCDPNEPVSTATVAAAKTLEVFDQLLMKVGAIVRKHHQTLLVAFEGQCGVGAAEAQ